MPSKPLRCPVCDWPLQPVRSTMKYCSPACRLAAWRERQARKPKRQPRRLTPGRNTSNHDLIMTPPALAVRIVEHFKPAGRCLEPCRGQGAFYAALMACPSVTSVAWCELAQDRDFFDWQEPVDWIVTNPPWSKILPFLKHSMTLSPNVVFLCSISHVLLKARLTAIHDCGFGLREALLLPHPDEWQSSGFQLAAVHVQKGYRGGLTMVRG